MSKISAIIVDDEIKNNELLNIYLEKYCPMIDVIGVSTTVEHATQKINDLKPKLIFLDIVMQDGTGFDVVEGINYDDYSVIFISAFQEYAVTAFKFNAIDFLLKPIDPKDLMTTVQTLEVNLKNKLFTTTPSDGIQNVTESSASDGACVTSMPKPATEIFAVAPNVCVGSI